MNDPQFEAIVAEIRGFDLGDDAELLARLDARMPELSGEQWLLRGVLLHRAGRGADAVQCLERAVAQGHARSQALYLQSCMFRETGEAASMGEALDALKRARQAAAEDGLLSTADLAHARGLLFWRAGNSDAALRWIDQAIKADEHSAARWLHRGQLLAELGRSDDAAEAFDRALTEEQDLDPAMYERAALEADRLDVEATAQWLTKATRLNPSLRSRAADDPRFEAMRGHLARAGLVASTQRADLRWLDPLAPWMSALYRDPELERLSVDLSIEWLDEARSQRIGEGLLADHERGPLGTMHTEATLARSRALLATRRAVAMGPTSCTRDGVHEPSLLFVDVQHPDQGLWLALSESYPPFLWIRIEPGADSLRAALAEYFPRPQRTRLDMPGQVRGFIGYRERVLVPSPYAGGLEAAGIAELDRHFAINPFVESAWWGSAHDDDPWPAQIPDQPGLTHKIAARQRLVSEQARGHVWSLTRRTRHSRSYLTIEVHHRDMFVAQLRYQPGSHAEVIEAMNAHFGCDYPTSLPVDAVAALLGFQFDSARDLAAELPQASSAEQLAGLLLVLSALGHGDLGVLELYRRYLDHPESVVRSTLVDIAVAHNHEVLLEEMSLREPEPELRQEIEALLDQGIPMPEDDPYAEGEEGDPEGDSTGSLLEVDDEDTVELEVNDMVGSPS
jgi:tetratricopeptide (TPR) repeat protein